jgi:hypothetical protein
MARFQGVAGGSEGVSRNWWDLAGIDMTGQEMLT